MFAHHMQNCCHAVHCLLQGCLKELVEREQQAVHSRQLQDERRGRHAHAALQTLLQDLERNAQVEDPQRTWQLVS